MMVHSLSRSCLLISSLAFKFVKWAGKMEHSTIFMSYSAVDHYDSALPVNMRELP